MRDNAICSNDSRHTTCLVCAGLMKQSNVTSAAAVVVAISIPGLASNYSIRSDIIDGRGSADRLDNNR